MGSRGEGLVINKVKSQKSKVKIFLGWIIFMLSLSLSSFSYAKEVGFEIGVEANRVSLGQSLELNLTFEGTQNIPALELSNLEGFQARYLGPSTRMSIVNGQVSS